MVIGHQDAVTRRQSPGDSLDSGFVPHKQQGFKDPSVQQQRGAGWAYSPQGAPRREPSSSPAGLEHLAFSSVRVQVVWEPHFIKLRLASSLLNSSCFHLSSARITGFYHHAGFTRCEGQNPGFCASSGSTAT